VLTDLTNSRMVGKNLTLPDYGRVARHRLTIGGRTDGGAASLARNLLITHPDSVAESCAPLVGTSFFEEGIR